MLVTNGLVLLALGLTRLVSANSWKSSRTLEISGKPYYIPAEPVLKLDSSKFSLGDLDLLPVTVFSTTGDSVTGSKLKSDIEQWLKLDDVFDIDAHAQLTCQIDWRYRHTTLPAQYGSSSSIFTAAV